MFSLYATSCFELVSEALQGQLPPSSVPTAFPSKPGMTQDTLGVFVSSLLPQTYSVFLFVREVFLELQDDNFSIMVV